MSTDAPSAALLMQAMEIYLPIAYPAGLSTRANAVRTQLAAAGEAAVKDPLVFCDPKSDRPRYWVRLGNASYPHMKLAIEKPAATSEFVLRVDTHDRHCCPEVDSPEHGAFCKLMQLNQSMAEQIEAAWEAEGLPTFKSFLRADLKARQKQIAEGRMQK